MVAVLSPRPKGWAQEQRSPTLHRGKEETLRLETDISFPSSLCLAPCGFSQKNASLWKSSCLGHTLAPRWPQVLSQNQSDKEAEYSLEAEKRQPQKEAEGFHGCGQSSSPTKIA